MTMICGLKDLSPRKIMFIFNVFNKHHHKMKNYFTLIFVILTATRAVTGHDYKIVDMTHVLTEDIPYLPFITPFNFVPVYNGTASGGGKSFWLQIENMNTSTHIGTHLDAPCHLGKGKWTLEEIPFERFILPAIVVDITEKAAADSNYTVAISDLEEWENKYGRIPEGCMVIMKSGWGKFWPDKEKYLGTTSSDASKLRSPGYSGEAALWLVENRNIFAAAVDTISLDAGYNRAYEAHTAFFSRNAYGIESLAKVEELPVTGATIVAMPTNIKNASGAPVRVFAQIPK